MKKRFTLLLALASFGLSQTYAQWAAVSSYGGGAAYSTASFVIDEKAYVGGGNPTSDAWYEYDPVADVWAQKTSIPGFVGRASPIAFAINGKGYIGGGASQGQGTTDTFYEYDPSSDTWTQKASFPGGFKHSGMYRAANGKGYVIGGSDGSNLVDEVWEYNPANDSWTQKTAFPGGAIYWPTGFAVGDKIYVGTGTVSGTGITDFYEYNTTTDTWTTKASFPGSARIGAVGFALAGKGYIGMGGTDDFTSNVTDFYEYDVAADSWTAATDLTYPNNTTAWSTAFLIDNDLYAGTGAWLAGGIFPAPGYNKLPDIGPSVGYDELGNLDDSWEVFPNPAKNQITLRSDEAQGNHRLEILDLLGKTAQTQNLNNGSTTIEVGHLPQGVYLLQISNDHGRQFVQRLVVQP